MAMTLPAALIDPSRQHIEAGREHELNRPRAGALDTSRGQLAFEGVEHLFRVRGAMPCRKRQQCDAIQGCGDHVRSPKIRWARAIASSARKRSDSARATARPKVVRR